MQVYLKNSRVPSTVLLTSMFYDSTVTVFPYQKQEDGSYVFTSNAGAKAHPQCATEDIGASAAGLLSLAQPHMNVVKIPHMKYKQHTILSLMHYACAH